jgi:hypothetical protein
MAVYRALMKSIKQWTRPRPATAIAAFSTRETHRIHMHNLGHNGAVPVALEEYAWLSAQSFA